MSAARILIVDDEPGMLRAVERVLSADYDVVATPSSRDALSIAAAFLPDLAIMDIRMPDLDGFELMARLKTRFPELDVILMTGSVDDLDEKLIRAIRSPAFFFIQKPFDREVLKTLVERCVELRWRREENRRHVRRLETEMAEASAFQQSLLPPREATVNGVAITCHYTPCLDLGGDLYDYAAAPSRQAALLVADVSGHGVSAAMLTAIVKSAFHASHVDGFDPSAVVERVASGLAAFSPERFVTLIAALVAPEAGTLRYVNAGHPRMAVWRHARELRWMDTTGPLVSPALFGACTWDVATVRVEAGEQLLMYTDGVSDVIADADGRAEARLADTIARARGDGASVVDAILGAVQSDLGDLPQPDDLTLLAARVLESAS
jgi:sigma-B regulation protein RsbU (phosphoserine phosphatase)